MKVFQINSVCGYGSTGKIAVDIYNVLTAAGGQCRIAYGRGTAPDGIDCVKITGELDVRLHGALSRITDKSGFYSKRATKRLINQIKAFDPDIIHLHNIHGYYLNVKLLFGFLKEYNRPVVWTLHDCWAFTGHCAYYDAAGCTKWQRGCNNCPNLSSYPKSFKDNSRNNYLIKKATFCDVDNLTLVTPSNWLKGEVSHSFLSKYRCDVINNGVNTDVFKPCDSNIKTRLGIENKKMLLGVASVWEERKGLADFISLAKKLTDDYAIVLVGLSDKQKKSLPENIIGITRTSDQKELALVYSAADFYINLTYEDNYPTTNLEALCCGTPVITYDTGGSGEPVSNDCGAVVPCGDIDAVISALNMPKNTERIAKIASNFDKSVCFEKYFELYKEILNA